MGNALFCPQLHQDGIDCVSGAGFVFMRHPPLLETFNLDDLDAHGVQGTLATKGSRVDVPSRKKDLAHYGFDYRFTDPTYEKEARTWTGKKSSTDTDVSSSNEFDFTTRLYHTKSNDMITKDNFRKFRLHGKLFDDVTDCCQEIVQQGLQDVYRYDVVTIPVSSQSSVSGGDATPPIQAFVSPDLAERLSIDEDVEPRKASTKEEKPVLLIICGKGQSRAGVLSTKQLVLSGLESGSAVYHILQAEEQQMSVIILDPNAWGERRGMEVVNHSLTYFFGEMTTDTTKEGTRISASARLSKCPLYIIAHSAAGAYLIRYLSQGVARETLLRQINRVAFTDSTHNLQWYNKDQRLWVYLQSSKCLYIRNNSAPRPFGNHHGKKAGEKHEGDHWWHHRFGNIPTVWAGTPEHSLMCWTARHVIWDFFTEKTKKTA